MLLQLVTILALLLSPLGLQYEIDNNSVISHAKSFDCACFKQPANPLGLADLQQNEEGCYTIDSEDKQRVKFLPSFNFRLQNNSVTTFFRYAKPFLGNCSSLLPMTQYIDLPPPQLC